MDAGFKVLIEMLWVSLKWNCAFCGNAFLLHRNIISIFSVMVMSIKTHLWVFTICFQPYHTLCSLSVIMILISSR